MRDCENLLNLIPWRGSLLVDFGAMSGARLWESVLREIPTFFLCKKLISTCCGMYTNQMQSIWTGFTMNALFSEESSHHWIKTNSKLYYFILNLYLVFECCWCSLFKCNVICLYVLRFKAQNGLAFLVLWFRQGSVSLGSAPLHQKLICAFNVKYFCMPPLPSTKW